MGHYASEMDPEWGASSRQAYRVAKLKAALEDVPASAFKAKDIWGLCKLYSYNSDGIPERVLRRFEKIAEAHQ